MTTIHPLYDKLVIRPDDPETKTKEGLLLPSSAKDQRKPRTGKVIAAGDGHLDTKLGGVNGHAPLVKLRVEVGQRVLFGAYAGTEVELDGEKLLIVPEIDVLGIIGEHG